MRETTTIWRDFLAVFPHIVTLEVGRYLITAALASVIIWAFWRAHYATRKIQARVASAKDYRREVLTSLRSALIFSMTGFGMYLAHKAGRLTIYEDFSVRGPLYFAATLVLMILAQDAYFYWTHRMMHHPRLFRTFHWTHHKSKTPTPWAAYAFDAPEAAIQVAFVPLWAAFVPMHDLAIFTFVTWQIVRNVVGHAGVEMFPVSGKPSRLFGWFNTTTHHDLHHQDGRSNYGLYFSWWDRWMGTEHPEYQARVAEVAERARTAKKRPAIAAPGILALALVLATLPSESRAQRAAAITGNWATRGFGSIVQFRPCGASSETMCGRIVWLWEPNDGNGRPRTDNHNPDRTLRTRSLVGVEIVRGLRETEPGVWSEGALYNPDDGRTYSGTLRLNNGVLELRGCAMSVFCQTQLWRRPEEVLAQVRGL
jgi:sterol desaturase/sphingolipid hydroxylase (fatty acid hydroxylase superfamily)